MIQKVYYDKSDDLYELAKLQKKYEAFLACLADDLNEDERKNFEENIEEIQNKIRAQQEIVNGYDSIEN